jgi:hypothetical protein
MSILSTTVVSRKGQYARRRREKKRKGRRKGLTVFLAVVRNICHSPSRLLQIGTEVACPPSPLQLRVHVCLTRASDGSFRKRELAKSGESGVGWVVGRKADVLQEEKGVRPGMGKKRKKIRTHLVIPKHTNSRCDFVPTPACHAILLSQPFLRCCYEGSRELSSREGRGKVEEVSVGAPTLCKGDKELVRTGWEALVGPSVVSLPS